MTELERLTALLREMSSRCNDTECEECVYNKQNDCQEKMQADYLLANGVIVPPVAVGDVVYKISRNKVKKCEVVFIGISADDRCSHFDFVEKYADGTFYKSYSMVFEVIGKTVFLTREEAEKALERSREC